MSETQSKGLLNTVIASVEDSISDQEPSWKNKLSRMLEYR